MLGESMVTAREKARVEAEERLRQAVAKEPRKYSSWWAASISRIGTVLSYFVGSPVAWLALIVSLTTAYFSFLRQTDDIRVIVNKSPIVTIDSAERIMTIKGPTNLTFINNGNRGVFIQRLSLAFARFNPAEGGMPIQDGCRGTQSTQLFYDLSPFIVDKSNFANKETSISQKEGVAVGGDVAVRGLPFQFFAPEKGDDFIVCLRVNLSTPDKFIYERDVILTRYVLELEADSVFLELPGDAALTRPTDPLLIHRSTSTLRFWDALSE